MPYPHPISDPNSALASGQNGKAAARRPEPVIPADVEARAVFIRPGL